MRAADAAKNTSALMEDTTNKVKSGTGIVVETNESFNKVADLVSEISAASREQAQGIDQVNTAVADMDKVVQQNASNAEENASASEELKAQAEQMSSFVKELLSIVEGSDNKAVSGHSSVTRQSKMKIHEEIEGPVEKSKAKSKSTAAYKTKEIDPEHVIPMGEEDFNNF